MQVNHCHCCASTLFCAKLTYCTMFEYKLYKHTLTKHAEITRAIPSKASGNVPLLFDILSEM